jgi:hypothetical protein
MISTAAEGAMTPPLHPSSTRERFALHVAMSPVCLCCRSRRALVRASAAVDIIDGANPRIDGDYPTRWTCSP